MAGLRTTTPNRVLVAGNLMLVALLTLHSLDHAVRQTAPVPAEAAVAGTAGLAAALGALALSVSASRWAPAATAFVGLTTAAGFVAVHVLPEWSVLSQPYADMDVDAVSWVGMLVPAVAAAGVSARAIRLLPD